MSQRNDIYNKNIVMNIIDYTIITHPNSIASSTFNFL